MQKDWIMSKTELIAYEEAVSEVRKEFHQFAMLYFHFCKTLVDEFGLEKAGNLIRKTLFDLSIERAEKLRSKAEELGLDYTPESFKIVSDIPVIGWVKELGKNHCPYAECWFRYFGQYPWFKALSQLYCNVIDTTNIEKFTHTVSHRLTKNVLEGDDTCERVYFDSENVKKGKYAYETE